MLSTILVRVTDTSNLRGVNRTHRSGTHQPSRGAPPTMVGRIRRHQLRDARPTDSSSQAALIFYRSSRARWRPVLAFGSDFRRPGAGRGLQNAAPSRVSATAVSLQPYHNVLHETAGTGFIPRSVDTVQQCIPSRCRAESRCQERNAARRRPRQLLARGYVYPSLHQTLLTLHVPAFLGVRFAQPPVGDLRLRPARSLNSTFKEADATAYSPFV